MRAIMYPMAILAYILLVGFCFLHFTVGEAFFDPSMEWPPQKRAWLIASQWAALLGPILGGFALYWALGREG